MFPEMISIGYDLLVLGGTPDGGGSNSGKLYKLSCSNQVCNWETLSKELQIPRYQLTAIALPDDFVECN